MEILIRTLYYVTRKYLDCMHFLHDAAGAVLSHTGKGPGCCYMIGQGPNTCLFGPVPGLLFCL